MFVCVCHAVCEREVRDVIARGAGSVAEVSKACRAGGNCGACHATISQMIGEASAQGDAQDLPKLVALRTRAA